MHHSLHVRQFTVMLDHNVRICMQTSVVVQYCMPAAGISFGCMYCFYCIVMLALHTWRAQVLLFEHVTGEGPLFFTKPTPTKTISSFSAILLPL